jgi:hypothetical protein
LDWKFWRFFPDNFNQSPLGRGFAPVISAAFRRFATKLWDFERCKSRSASYDGRNVNSA